MDRPNDVDSTNMITEMPIDAAETVEMVEAVEDAEKPLYIRCHNFTKLSAIIQLLNLKKGNEMYSSTYEVKKAFKAMGSGNEYTDLAACPTYGKSRWKVDEQKNKIYNNIPAKCLWYFPIIPRFKRLSQSKTTTKDLTWHATERKVDVGVLSHPADSPAWAAIDDKYPDLACEPRNLRLGISADGVDMNRGNRSHSVWPVLTVIYNLPPWLCMKRKFIMLSLLISGTPGNNIDVFLAPFIDNLQLLFDFGVATYDAYAQEHFKLHAVVLWTINDYPTLGTLSGCPYNDFQGYAVCGEETQCIRLSESNKQGYAGHRRFLPYGHPSRRQKKEFNGQQEFSPSPEPMNGEEIYNRNVGESLTRTVLNVPEKTKDGYKARLDLVHCGLKPELHPQIEGNNTTLPAAGCTLTKEEKDKLCETLYNLKVPQSKEIIVDELDKLQEELCVTLCLLEKHFPPSFSNVMIHLNVHLTREVKLCGPIFFRWMYPFERFMKVIKGYVRNKNRPEGCIAEENVTEETIEFFSQFLKRMVTVGIPPDNHNNCGIHKSVDSSSIADSTPVSAAKSVEVFAELFNKAHFFVLQNTSEVLLYIKNGVKRDKLGYTLVELKRLGHKGDPFILASQAQQVFYVTDLLDQKMSIVFKTPPKNYKDTYEDVDE
ncbi:hypothetical protein Lser_V15G29251 [Lactuca serriola]